jgi:uncharacterized repeat protein (TIGR01451 family)
VLLSCASATAFAQAPGLVKDIFPGAGSSLTFTLELADLGGSLLFAADDGVHGRELWRSDGTAAGTVLVRDIQPGAGSSAPSQLTVSGGLLFFVANDGIHGDELWRSDGTEPGTVMVRDIRAGTETGGYSGLIGGSGVLFFAVVTPESGRELWKSDGTEAGTMLVKDIWPGAGDGTQHGIGLVRGAIMNGILFFSAYDGTSSSGQLWRSDGTAPGTFKVKDVSGTPENLINVDGTLFFSTRFGFTTVELWKSDGSQAGTVRVKTLATGSLPFGVNQAANVNGTLFFVLAGGLFEDPIHSLWRSDGTEDGTFAIAAGSGTPYLYLTELNGALLFARGTYGSGVELWRSNGTSAGTVLVKDIRPGPSGSGPSSLRNVNGTLYFNADDGLTGRELWKSDGTAAGTVRVRDIQPGAGSSTPTSFTLSGPTLYFAADDGSTGRELWAFLRGVADLSVSKTDGQTTVVAGEPVTYTVTVTNAGPDAVIAATVTDTFPPALSSVSWTCAASAGSSCASPSGTGNIDQTVDLLVGGTATFVVTGTVSPDASGMLTNTATVSVPSGFSDPTLANNSATDTDTIVVQADLSISKTDGSTTAGAGSPVTYTIIVTNAGPSAVTGATVSDTFPAALTGVTWTCSASGGSSCGTASGSGNINHTVNLLVGGTATFTATGTLDVNATGTLSNTATVAVPGGASDPVPGNNSATDNDTIIPAANLSITKTDGQTTAAPGQAITYTIVASNAGPNPVTGATVSDTFPAALAGVTWTCTASAGSSCGAAGGAGNINTTVNLLVGGTATFTATGTVVPNPTSLSNTATITPPPTANDPNPADNSATDTDTLVCFSETVVVPDGRLTEATVDTGATVWFAASLRIGNAYSVELKNLTGSVPPGILTVFSGDDGCSGTSTATVNDTSNTDPAATGGLSRVSFTAAGTETFFRARLVNTTGAPVTISFGWSDLTLFSPAWSTNGSFDTYYSFQNTTGATVSGTLTLLDTSGAVQSAFGLVVPAGQTASANTATLGVTRNRAGTVRFVHDGPPGAIVAETAIANFTISPAYVQPVKFQAVREAR